MDFLNRFHRWSRQGLANRIEHRAIGLHLAADAKDFARVQREAAVRDIAGGISVKQIVRIHAVERKQIAGIALTVGNDSLVAKPFVRPGARKEVRAHAGSQNRKLSEAPGSER